MMGILDRRSFVELAIMVAVCVGGWLLLVEPRATELRKLEMSIDAAHSNPLINDHGTVERLADQIAEVRDRVAVINRQNEFGRDSSSIYGAITSLASEHKVLLDRLDPGTPTPNADESVLVASFDMRVRGRYRQLAAFLDAVEDIEGFVRPVRLNLIPQSDEGTSIVDARFQCEAVTFRMPDALTALVGDNDVDQ